MLVDKYCDTSKVTIIRTTKSVVQNIITKKHYAKKWTESKHIYAIYWDEGESEFFEDRKLKLIGAILYGHPVGFRVVKSISDELENGDVLEIRRLWIEDGYGKNIESYVISQTLKMVKKYSPQTKIVISFADPSVNHKGIIYRACNFYYQGENPSSIGSNKYQYRYPNSKVWMSTRAMKNKVGTSGHMGILNKIPDIEYRKSLVKYRYLYFLCNRKEKKRLIKSLKYPLVSYD
tara:strand:- start:70 stop:768 length:699 start_codon:yes stop_codon:yes gene_type:complete